MSFKKTFEKNLNKELEADLDNGESSTSGPLPPIDISYNPPYCPPPPPPPPPPAPQPPQVFESYPARRGMYVPTPIFILFLLVFIFESTVLFVYTTVALYNTLPANIVPKPMTLCPEPQHQPINFAPNFLIPSTNGDHQAQPTIQVSTVTVTAIPSSSSTTTSSTSSTTTTSSTSSSKKEDPVTVTKPAPTITVISTASTPQLPEITTETVLSTQSLGRSTVTSVALVTPAQKG